MRIDERLGRELLKKLAEREAALEEGDITVVQPTIEGHNVTHPLSVTGYDHDQIDGCLRQLVASGFVDNGGVEHPLIGIHFRRLTAAGRRLLSQ